MIPLSERINMPALRKIT